MVKQIALTQGKVSLVDDEDYKLVCAYSWQAARNGSSWRAMCRTGSGIFKQTIYMHRLIMRARKGQEIDHINGDALDNRKSNLRFCTRAENTRNRGTNKNNASGYKGVAWHSQVGRWRAYIVVDRKQKSLGLFDTPEQAARAYNEAALKMFGDYARLNDIP